MINSIVCGSPSPPSWTARPVCCSKSSSSSGTLSYQVCAHQLFSIRRTMSQDLHCYNDDHHQTRVAASPGSCHASLSSSATPNGPPPKSELSKVTHDANWGISTQILHHKSLSDAYDAASTPLYQTATFRQPSATEGGPYDYTRSGNPTRTSLEELLAKLDGADRAFCFTSGMAALSTVLTLVPAGAEIVAGDDVYGGSDRLLTRVAPKSGVAVTRVDTSDLKAVEAAMKPETKLVWLESPTNPRMMIVDIRRIAEIAHRHGALVMVDNSILSPVLMRPIDLGADIVMHSATKFISGHSDVSAGVLAVKGESLAKDVYFLQNAQGAGLAPFDCWLCLRGLKTMALRVERQQASAQKVAEFLDKHPAIGRVQYAGLPHHTGHELHFSQASGAGVVISFTTGSLEVSKHIVESTRLFDITVSFGSVTSTCSLPCFMSHASIPSHVRIERGLEEDLVRLSIGLEDVEDLIADLDRAIATAPGAAAQRSRPLLEAHNSTV